MAQKEDACSWSTPCYQWMTFYHSADQILCVGWMKNTKKEACLLSSFEDKVPCLIRHLQPGWTRFWILFFFVKIRGSAAFRAGSPPPSFFFRAERSIEREDQRWMYPNEFIMNVATDEHQQYKTLTDRSWFIIRLILGNTNNKQFSFPPPFLYPLKAARGTKQRKRPLDSLENSVEQEEKKEDEAFIKRHCDPLLNPQNKHDCSYCVQKAVCNLKFRKKQVEMSFFQIRL